MSRRRFLLLTKIAVLGLSFCSWNTVLLAQSSNEICRTLVNEKLIDTNSDHLAASYASAEFTDFCDTTEDVRSTFSEKSRSFQGSFTSAGRSLGLNAGSNNGSGLSDEYFRQVCEKGSDSFVSEVTSANRASSGAIIALEFNRCIATLAASDQTVLTGTVTGNEKFFVASFDYRAPRSLPTPIKLSNINGDAVSCYRNSSDATSGSQPIGPNNELEIAPNSNVDITCVLPQEIEASVGSFGFMADTGETFATVSYEYVTSSAIDRISEQYSAQLNDLGERLKAIESLDVIGRNEFTSEITSTANALREIFQTSPTVYAVYGDRSGRPGDVPLSSQPGAIIDPGRPDFLRLTMIPANEGFCFLAGVGSLAIPHSGTRHLVEVKDGNWIALVHRDSNGYTRALCIRTHS